MKLTCVVKEPNKEPQRCDFETDDVLATLQKAVDGYIELVRVGDDVFIVCNEDGLAYNLPDNCGFVGNIVFVQDVLGEDNEKDLGSLSEENVQKAIAWCNRYKTYAHPDRSGMPRIITGDEEIKKYRDALAEDGKSKLLEWESL
jgi:hypothetical protein